MVVFGLMNALLPIFFVAIGIYAYAEFTGQSQMSKSFDNPYLFVACLWGYFLFAFVMSRLAQKRTVFRIYFNEKLGKFVLFRLKGLTSFSAEKFTSKDVIYRMPTVGRKTLINSVQNAQGNVFINNQLMRLEFSSFSVPGTIEKMCGTKAFNLIRLELNKMH